jgi:hypothetical protein
MLPNGEPYRAFETNPTIRLARIWAGSKRREANDLPVQEVTSVEMVINALAARPLCVTVPLQRPYRPFKVAFANV